MASPGTRPARPVGRRSKLTPERHAIIVEAIRDGATLDAAAGAAGVDERTLYRWLADAEQPGARKALRQFRQDVYRARDELEVRVARDSVLKSAIGGYVVKEVTRYKPDGTEEHEQQIAPADGRVGLEMLARRFPDRWARRASVEVSGPGGGAIQVEHSAVLASLAERLHRELGDESGQTVQGELEDGSDDT